MSVPLPPPEGELMTKRMPRSTSVLCVPCPSNPAAASLFNVLHLLSQFFGFAFDREGGFFDRKIGGL